MYILPNKKQIDMDKLEEAFLDLDVKNIYYLDAETGKITSNKDKTKSQKNEERYLIVPKLSNNIIISWMTKFAEEFVSFDESELRKKLLKALKTEKPIKHFMDLLTADKGGWIHGWSQWQNDNLYEEIINWFCDLTINIEDDMSELDDNCPLCRMMKEGVNDLETLKKGFQEVNTKQMVDNIFKNINNNNS